MTAGRGSSGGVQHRCCYCCSYIWPEDYFLCERGAEDSTGGFSWLQRCFRALNRSLAQSPDRIFFKRLLSFFSCSGAELHSCFHVMKDLGCAGLYLNCEKKWKTTNRNTTERRTRSCQIFFWWMSSGFLWLCWWRWGGWGWQTQACFHSRFRKKSLWCCKSFPAVNITCKQKSCCAYIRFFKFVF